MGNSGEAASRLHDTSIARKCTVGRDRQAGQTENLLIERSSLPTVTVATVVAGDGKSLTVLDRIRNLPMKPNDSDLVSSTTLCCLRPGFDSD